MVKAMNEGEAMEIKQVIKNGVVYSFAGGTSSDEYQELLNRYNDLASRFSTLQGQYVTLQGQYDELYEDNTQLQNTYNQLNNTYTQLQATYNELQEAYDDLLARYNALLEENTSLKSQISELQGQLSTLQSQFDALQQQYNELQGNYSNLQSQYNTLNSQYSTLLARYEALEGAGALSSGMETQQFQGSTYPNNIRAKSYVSFFDGGKAYSALISATWAKSSSNEEMAMTAVYKQKGEGFKSIHNGTTYSDNTYTSYFDGFYIDRTAGILYGLTHIMHNNGWSVYHRFDYSYREGTITRTETDQVPASAVYTTTNERIGSFIDKDDGYFSYVLK